MGVVYNERKNEYKVFIPLGGRKYKQFTFSVNRYGEFAKKLAEISYRDKRRYNDYFEIEGDTAIFKVNTKAYGVVEVYFDIEDIEKVIPYKLSISKDSHAKTFYCKVANGAGIHRIIMDVTDPKNVVDHIDRNGLNNRKSNLRIVDTSINNRNSNLRHDSSTGVRGVTYEKEKRYRAEWYDKDGRKRSKSFSINKYGKEKAFELAVNYRRQQELLNNYIPVPQERSETIMDT
jgi:hypothetical protein